MQASLIIVAAGKSKRMKIKTNKAFLKIAGKPILFHTLEKFRGIKFIKEIVLVMNKDDIKKFARIYKKHFGKLGVTKIVPGGKRRQDSVYNGLLACDNSSRYVIIHDAVRPFVTRKTILAVCAKARKTGAAIAAQASTDTLKLTSGNVIIKTLDREKIYKAQTPQVFQRQLLLRAIKKADFRRCYTDEAQILEAQGYKVVCVISDSLNLKITVPEDVKLAKAIFPLNKQR